MADKRDVYETLGISKNASEIINLNKENLGNLGYNVYDLGSISKIDLPKE